MGELKTFRVRDPLPRSKPKADFEYVRVRRRPNSAKKHKARFTEKKGTKHIRTLARGEITAYIAIAIEFLFAECIPVGDQHNPYTAKNVRNMIRGGVEPWVRRYGRDKEFKLMPSMVTRAMKNMTASPDNKLAFRIDGNVIQLIGRRERLTVHHELVPPRSWE